MSVVVSTKPVRVSQGCGSPRVPGMNDPERTHEKTYVVHGSDEGPPPPGNTNMTVRYATFGKDRVQVEGDLLATLEAMAEDGR